MTKPKTQKEQIDQLWMVVIGTNGDGLKFDIQYIKEKIEDIKKTFTNFLLNREETCPNNKRKYRNLPLIMSGLAAIAAIGALIINLIPGI